MYFHLFWGSCVEIFFLNRERTNRFFIIYSFRNIVRVWQPTLTLYQSKIDINRDTLTFRNAWIIDNQTCGKFWRFRQSRSHFSSERFWTIWRQTFKYRGSHIRVRHLVIGWHTLDCNIWFPDWKFQFNHIRVWHLV